MNKVCRWLMLVGLMILASACVPMAPPPSAIPAPIATSTGTPLPAPAFLGQFDCYGLEAGVRAYAGRVSLEPGGTVMFADRSGQWTYDAATATLTFAGSTDLGMATYVAGDDTLVVQSSSGAALPHADDGRLDCVRAVPGITGP